MSVGFAPANPALHEAVRQLYRRVVNDFRAEAVDFNSEIFLGRFPFIFVDEISDDPSATELRERLVSAAFSDEFRSRTEEAIGIFYADHSGGTIRRHFCSLIDDFMNHAIPRIVGLPDEDARFDRLYSRFESDLLSDTFTLECIALLENISDHGSAFHQTAGVRFAWACTHGSIAVSNAFLRDRVVPYLEIKKSAHPIAAGRELGNKNAFFVLEFQEARPKTKTQIQEAYARSEEITKKVSFALRLLTSSPVFSDYRGFRMPGHYSAHRMILMNWPDEQIGGGFSQDLQVYARGLEALLPHVLSAPSGAIAVIYDKIEDSFRRHRSSVVYPGAAEKRVAIDRLLDYFQALEAVIPVEGSYQIALYAAVLLGAASRQPGTAPDVFQFIKDMHNLRNAVVHGRLDEVLEGRVKTRNELNVHRLAHIVHELVILYLLNPDDKGKRDLRPLAHRLALGEAVALRTLYGP